MHFYVTKGFENIIADNEEFYDAINEMEYGIDKNIIINDKQVKKVTEDLNNSEETGSFLRLEVLEL